MPDLTAIAYRALREGDRDARECFARAINADPGNAALYIGLAEARFAAGESEAWLLLDPLLSLHPEWVEGQKMRAELRWESGWGLRFADGFRHALAQLPNHADLWNAYIAALAGAGDQLGAADAAREAQTYFDLPVLRLIEASHADLGGDHDRAAHLLTSVPERFPGRAMVEVRRMIRMRQADEAERLLQAERLENPDNLSCWALTDIVWRQLNDPRANWLGGDPSLIRTHEIGLCPAEIERLAAILRQLHRPRQRPIGQSVRGGTQTRGPLLDRSESEVQRLKTAFQAAIDHYVDNLPPYDPTHPLLRHRNRALMVEGGWSVRLTDAGYHLSHLHPAGVVSSACYIAVPEFADSWEGCLELGSAPADLGLDISPRTRIDAKVGRLVLFPSFMYHGTRPFRASERLTVAFDAA
ncbi:MAG: putative 2OG-Fe(II) oxygenase [Sphingomonas sp.]